MTFEFTIRDRPLAHIVPARWQSAAQEVSHTNFVITIDTGNGVVTETDHSSSFFRKICFDDIVIQLRNTRIGQIGHLVQNHVVMEEEHDLELVYLIAIGAN